MTRQKRHWREFATINALAAIAVKPMYWEIHQEMNGQYTLKAVYKKTAIKVMNSRFSPKTWVDIQKLIRDIHTVSSLTPDIRYMIKFNSPHTRPDNNPWRKRYIKQVETHVA